MRRKSVSRHGEDHCDAAGVDSVSWAGTILTMGIQGQFKKLGFLPTLVDTLADGVATGRRQ
jgi:hypothetical protein